MKKILTLVAAAFVLNASAQTSIQLTNINTSVTIQPNAVLYAETVPEDVLTFTIDIKNTGTSTQTYKVARFDQLLHVGTSFTASAYFCVAGTCYPAETDTSQNSLVLAPGQSASQITGDYQMLQADLFEAETKGLSIVKYVIYNVNNANDFVEFTFKYNAVVTGIAEAKGAGTHVKVYPNPASSGIINVVSAGDHNKVEIINLLGSTVLKQENTGNSVYALNISDLPAGTYFIKVSGDRDSVTEKLIITK